MTARERFSDAANATVQAEIERLRAALSFALARALPEAEAKDVLIAGKEVQLTTFRQAALPALKGQVLVTVQLLRIGLGGVVAFRAEKGLVFAAGSDPRDATEAELKESGG